MEDYDVTKHHMTRHLTKAENLHTVRNGNDWRQQISKSLFCVSWIYRHFEGVHEYDGIFNTIRKTVTWIP